MQMHEVFAGGLSVFRNVKRIGIQINDTDILKGDLALHNAGRCDEHHIVIHAIRGVSSGACAIAKRTGALAGFDHLFDLLLIFFL